MESREFGIGKLISSVLIPTTVFTGLYICLGLHFQKLPSMLLFFLVAVVTLFPVELAMIARESKREYGKYSLRSALIGQDNMKLATALFPGFLAFAYAGICNAVIFPLETKIMASVVDVVNSRTPVFFQWDNMESIQHYPKNVLYVALIIYFIGNVIVGPIVEELFFRGFLTRKLERFGNLAPVIVTVLFSLYHFWLPFQNIFRIAVFLPVSYITWKKKNLYISIVFHCTCNLFSTVSFIIMVFGR